MILFVNEKMLILFEGATVKDALQMFGNNALTKIEKGYAEVLDAHGNTIGINGALHESIQIFFRIIDK